MLCLGYYYFYCCNGNADIVYLLQYQKASTAITCKGNSTTTNKHEPTNDAFIVPLIWLPTMSNNDTKYEKRNPIAKFTHSLCSTVPMYVCAAAACCCDVYMIIIPSSSVILIINIHISFILHRCIIISTNNNTHISFYVIF